MNQITTKYSKLTAKKEVVEPKLDTTSLLLGKRPKPKNDDFEQLKNKKQKIMLPFEQKKAVVLPSVTENTLTKKQRNKLNKKNYM